MVPAAYQIPLALAWVVGGVVSCFVGYRIFRLVLAGAGFFLGGLMASSLVGASDNTWLIGAWLVGGLIGMGLLYAGYYVGVALFGAGLGALLVNLAFRANAQEPPFVLVLVASVLGAIGSMYLQRYVIVFGTAFGGAWTLILGVMAMMGDAAARAAATGGNVWVVYPLNPAPGRWWLPYAWIALGLVGTAVQLGWTGGEKGRIRMPRKKRRKIEGT
jgi:hypothetical protein